MQASVTPASQSFRLRERMEQANIRHGQTVTADLANVRVLVTAGRSGEIFFCNMEPMNVKEVVAAEGDQHPLPAEVVLEGLDFPASGYYDISNARVSANGAIRISADGRTRVRARGNVISQLLAGSFSGL